MSRSLTTQTPTGTTGSITVPSVTGFNAGDLVYYRNGDYGRVADNAATTAPFVNTTPAPTYKIPGSNGLETVSSLNGGTPGMSSALLTNGNIVQVFCANQSTTGLTLGRFYFQIISSTGTIVVSPTVLSTTYTSNSGYNGSIGVLALTGGGFVAFWQCPVGGTVNTLVYGVFTNTGSVTTAVQQDTSITFDNISCPQIRGVGLANGGFVLAGNESSTSIMKHRIYNSAGTALYAWTSSTAPAPNPASGVYMFGIAARSDSSFIITYPGNGASNAQNYYITSATNTPIASQQIAGNSSIFTATGAPNGAIYNCDATILSDGTTFVISAMGIPSNSTFKQNQVVYRKIPTGNALGSEIALPNNSLNYSYQTGIGKSLNVKGLSNGGLMIAWAGSNQTIYYVVMNSSDVLLTGTYAKEFDGVAFNTSYQTIITPIEVSGYVYLFYSPWSTQFTPLAYLRIETTNWDMVPTSTSIAQSTIVGSAPVSGYILNGSTPSIAKFTASTSGSVSTVVPAMLLTSPQQVSNPYGNTSSATLASASFPDGRFVIVSRATQPAPATFTVVANLYSAQGVLTKSILVTDVYLSLNSQNGIAVTTLTSGKFVVMWAPDDNKQWYGTIFSSEGTALNEFVTSTSYYCNASNSGVTMCGISNDRFVVMGYDGSVANAAVWTVYSSAGIRLTTPANMSGTSGASCRGMNSAPTPYGFMVSACVGSSNAVFAHYVETSTNVFSLMQSYSGGMNAYTPISYTNMATNATCASLMFPNTDTNTFNIVTLMYGSTNNTTSNSGSSIANVNATPRFSMCSLSSGGIAYAVATSTTSMRIGFVQPGGANVGSSDSDGSYYLQFYTNFFSNYCVNISPLSAETVLVTWTADAGTPMYVIARVRNVTQAVALVSGTTQSGNVGINPGTGGTGVTNYVFQGVAMTTASAGGTGQVQTSGVAQLNSSYSASTAAQSFDHQSPNGSGITGTKGTIVGRTVNLLGNS
jgi:hypothetical protein